MGIFSNFSIKKSLTILIFISISGMLLSSTILIYSERNQLLEDRQDLVKYLVDSKVDIIQNLYEQYQAGKLTEKQAQTIAKSVIRAARYDNENYFWINDTSLFMVMHPTSPELEGQDISTIEDADGIYLFKEALQAVKTGNGSGFIHYKWDKNGENGDFPKVSYVASFGPWNWIVGTGMYLDDINASFYTLLIKNGLVVLVLITLLLFISTKIKQSISNPLEMVKSTIADIQSNHILTKRIKKGSDNEIGQIVNSVNQLMDEFQKTITTALDASQKTNLSASMLETVSHQTKNDVEQTKMEITQMVVAMTQMSSTVDEVAKNAANAAKAASVANDETKLGQSIVSETISSINQVADEVMTGVNTINRLEDQVESISKIIDVINGIAEQTNLLALNAAIEAARAGEQGRGFAVVADEVRTLAQRTQESTKEILNNVESLQKASLTAVKAMDNSKAKANNCVEAAAKAGKSLDIILASVADITQQNMQIAAAAEEQSQVTHNMRSNTDNIAHLADTTLDGANKTSLSSSELNVKAKELQANLSLYTV